MIGQMGQTIRAIDPSDAAKRDKIEQIQSYIREKSFPKELRKKIMEHYRRAARGVGTRKLPPTHTHRNHGSHAMVPGAF